MKPIVTPNMLGIVRYLRRQAETGLWHGNGLTDYMRRCHADCIETGARLFYTRDTGHHSSGWFKNPDYERCYHLSVSFREPLTGTPRPFEQEEALRWVELLFGRHKRLLWEESAKSPRGIDLGVRHYRLFCDPFWQPMKPRGEVYSTEFTELGWKSWSEVHAYPMTPVMASLTSGEH